MKETEIAFPNSIRQLKQLAEKYHLDFAGMGTLHYCKSNSHDPTHTSCDDNTCLINVQNIREFNARLKTVQTCIVGLGNTIDQLLNVLEGEVPIPLLNNCLNVSYSEDKWGISLMEAIFNNSLPSLFRLYLYLTNTNVQVLKDGSFRWYSFRNIIDKSGNIKTDGFIPIKLRLNLYNETKYVLISSQQEEYSKNMPHFAGPNILGQIELRSSEITDIKFLFAYNGSLIDLTSRLRKIIHKSYPCVHTEIESLLEKEQIFSSIRDIHYVPYLKQAITVLLAPSFV